MEGFSLKNRAIVFAVAAGAVAFILSLAAGWHQLFDVTATRQALVAAILCGVLSWASAERAISRTASAIDAAILRLSRAAEGDLKSGIPDEVAVCAPPLADAMQALFRQLDDNLESAQQLALFDPVTGLPNRTNFRRNCERLLADGPADAAAALYFVDLDRFKLVNDTLGHAVGDKLLDMVAGRLRTVANRFAEGAEPEAQPLVARLSGDEFTLFVPRLSTPECADEMGREILFALSEPFSLYDQLVEIGASIGIALRPDHGDTLSELMRAADAAMYYAKANGRGRTEHFSTGLAAEIEERVKLESDLRTALDCDQFNLVYQPQVNAIDGHVVGAEALLRWEHPEGTKYPGAFIACAEETGLIVEIGDWVVARVADTITRWAALGIEQRLAVNVSRRQLGHANFFHSLRHALNAAGAPARLLELEITETLAANCSPDVLAAIEALRRDGATVAIDDFGTGYTNVLQLRDLPVDRVKLDPALTGTVAQDPGTRLVVQALIALIHAVGCEAVAEGIETSDQAEVLRIIGCDVLQGYGIARPMPEPAFLEWVWAPEQGRQIA